MRQYSPHASPTPLTSMNWQTPVALVLVALTALAFLWRRFRPRRFSFHKSIPCGCTSATPPRSGGLVVSGRRGEAPRITLKP